MYLKVIRFLQAEGMGQGEIHRRLVSVYGQNVVSQKEMSVWCNKLKDAQTALKGDPEIQEADQEHHTLMKLCHCERIYKRKMKSRSS
jgi:hypothetical protein